MKYNIPHKQGNVNKKMNKFKIIREKLQKTQNEMAKSLGIALGSYQRYESGDSVPNFGVMQKLCDLDVNIYFLLDKSEEILHSHKKTENNDSLIETVSYLTKRCAQLEKENQELKLFSKHMGEVKGRRAS